VLRTVMRLARHNRKLAGNYQPSDKIWCLTYGMCRYAALANGAPRARHGVADLS